MQCKVFPFYEADEQTVAMAAISLFFSPFSGKQVENNEDVITQNTAL